MAVVKSTVCHMFTIHSLRCILPSVMVAQVSRWNIGYLFLVIVILDPTAFTAHVRSPSVPSLYRNMLHDQVVLTCPYAPVLDICYLLPYSRSRVKVNGNMKQLLLNSHLSRCLSSSVLCNFNHTHCGNPSRMAVGRISLYE